MSDLEWTPGEQTREGAKQLPLLWNVPEHCVQRPLVREDPRACGIAWSPEAQLKALIYNRV